MAKRGIVMALGALLAAGAIAAIVGRGDVAPAGWSDPSPAPTVAAVDPVPVRDPAGPRMAPSAASPERSLPAAGAQAEHAELVGVGSHQLDRRSIQHLVDLGVRHVRTTLYWGLWTQDAGYRRSFAAELNAAIDAGLDPLIVVHQQPSGGYADRDRVYREFARFMAERAEQFPGVRYWQLWNEMDVTFTDVFGAGRDDVSLRERGRNYARMLHLAYPAIKRANPSAVVVTGGIASDISAGFLHGLYDGDAPYDVLAIHSYGFPVLGSFRDRGGEARGIMAAHGDARPLWNTEFGMEKAVVPPDWPASRSDVDRYHLESWQEPIELNARQRVYDRVYGHVLFQDGDQSFDLVRRDGSPRPAYTWLKGWLRD